MYIKAGGYTVDKFNDVNVSLRYDTIADTFSFTLLFDPNNAAHKAIFKPCANKPCQIYYLNGKGQNELVITGTILSNGFSSSAKKELSTISGYSNTGIFADSCVFEGQLANVNQIVNADGSIQYNNLSLQEIANRIIFYSNISLVVDSNVADTCSKPFASATAGVSETIESFLGRLCTSRGVVLSHTVDGHLLFTKCKAEKNITPTTFVTFQTKGDTSQYKDRVDFGNSSASFDSKPIYNLEPGQDIWTRMDLSIDGQKLHSNIHVVGQQGNTNASSSYKDNPFVKNAFRYKRSLQTSGDDNDTPDTARTILGAELKAITLTIDIVGWEFNGVLVRPNNIITVLNPEIYLYKSTRWFIESVELRESPKGDNATITCVLPAVYNEDDVVNIFD